MTRISSSANVQMTKDSCRRGFNKIWNELDGREKVALRAKMEQSGRKFDEEGKCEVMKKDLAMEWACNINHNGRYDGCVVEVGGEAAITKTDDMIGTIHYHPFQNSIRNDRFTLEPPFMSDKDMPSAFRSAIWEHDEGSSRYHCIHMDHETVCYDLSKYTDEVSQNVNKEYIRELDVLIAQSPAVYDNDPAKFGYMLDRLVKDGWVTEKRALAGQDMELE
jgi:hypothetical protein